jgi:GT2 family glycosyltransferase
MSTAANPEVWVIILNWNGWRDTLACLDSLKRLDAPHRVLVVDNGSTDESLARLGAVLDPEELLATGHNLGFAGGVNAGVRHALAAGARRVWLLNNDTVVAPGTLGAMLEVLGTNPRVGVVGSVLRYFHAPDRVQAWGAGSVRWWLGLPRHHTSRRGTRDFDYLIGASLLIRAEVFDDVGLFDERFFLYWEDVDFSLRARSAGWELAVADGSVVLHKEGASANAGARTRTLSAEVYHLRSLVRVLRKHRRAWPLPLAVRMCLEAAHQLRAGQAKRIVPLLRAVREAVREPV